MFFSSQHRSWSRTLASLALVACCLGLSAGCSSDDDGGITVVCLTFEPAAGPTSGVVVTQVASDECNLLILEMVVTGVSDVLGASFTIEYPVDIAQFLQLTDVGDSFLARDGVNVISVAQETTPGTVVVSLTREGDVGVVADATEDLLVRLIFLQTSDNGTGDVIPTNADLFSPGPLGPIPLGITFEGGTFTIAPL